MSKRYFSQTYGVVGAIVEKNGKILLVKETKKIAKGLWCYPAGWINIKEETGYVFTPDYIIGFYSSYQKCLKKKFSITPHSIKIIFSGEISKKNKDKLANDVSRINWFTPEEIYQMDKNTLRNIDAKQIFKDYFAKKRYPLKALTHIVNE